jgi:hypothetical protein
MGGQGCFRCGRDLPPGKLKYVVHIRVYADFDGFLSIDDEETEAGMAQVLEEIESRDPEEMEREVYQEVGFFL